MIPESITLVISEIALSLYPQLIKLTNTNITSQISIRFITYTILAILGYFISPIHSSSLSSILNYPITQYLSLGLINILHVAVSYIAFHFLSSGVGYSLFYTYPIFNLLGRSLIFQETIKPSAFLYIILAILGVYLITNKEYSENATTPAKIIPTNPTNQITTETEMISIGVFAGLLSAITESIIYLTVRNTTSIKSSSYQEILRFYSLGAVIGIILIVYNYYKNTTNTDTKTNTTPESPSAFFSFQISGNDVITLVLFNALIGFLGYIFRFYAIPRINTIEFNSLIFLGVIFSYLWGFFLSGETIHPEYILGSLLIIISIYLVN